MGTRVRSTDDVVAHVEQAARFGVPGTVGIELEHFAVDVQAPAVRPDLARVDAALAGVHLPGRSVLSTEPGGQVELSTAPAHGPAAAVASLEADLAAASTALAAAGIALVGRGADPDRPPRRLVHSPRYDAMEAFFDQDGPAGRAMMCSTAAIQVSLDLGARDGGVQSAAARWQRAHAIGPALVAAFACSPRISGRTTGWRSSRQQVWSAVDPSRTSPPDPSLGPVEAVASAAMSARLMTVRGPDGTCRSVPYGATFGDWVRDGAPTTDDLASHLSTLFPPVRLRGWLEVRYLDALPGPLWQVAVAVTAALLEDAAAADLARAACAPVEGLWLRAARDAVTDPALQRAALSCLEAAAAALPRLGAPALGAATSAYAEAWTARGRCPADALLESGRLLVPA